jgi:hypothetical protein
LEVLVRRYSFAYREPLVYSTFAVVAIALGGGFLLFQTSLHRVLFNSAEHQGLPPPINAFYRGFGEQRFEDIHHGEVLATTSDGFILQESYENATESVVIASDTELPPEGAVLPADTVVVFGPESGTIVQAVGIRKAGSDILWVAPPGR